MCSRHGALSKQREPHACEPGTVRRTVPRNAQRHLTDSGRQISIKRARVCSGDAPAYLLTLDYQIHQSHRPIRQLPQLSIDNDARLLLGGYCQGS